MGATSVGGTPVGQGVVSGVSRELMTYVTAGAGAAGEDVGSMKATVEAGVGHRKQTATTQQGAGAMRA